MKNVLEDYVSFKDRQIVKIRKNKANEQSQQQQQRNALNFHVLYTLNK